ncbi:hypothetical protein S40288_10971 [Stachybotrys chartarum IBT 40288]|nr:hypothetical protein S40288_10971 [Stachybotrys chartarum IBT 40288]
MAFVKIIGGWEVATESHQPPQWLRRRLVYSTGTSNTFEATLELRPHRSAPEHLSLGLWIGFSQCRRSAGQFAEIRHQERRGRAANRLPHWLPVLLASLPEHAHRPSRICELTESDKIALEIRSGESRHDPNPFCPGVRNLPVDSLGDRLTLFPSLVVADRSSPRPPMMEGSNGGDTFTTSSGHDASGLMQEEGEEGEEEEKTTAH